MFGDCFQPDLIKSNISIYLPGWDPNPKQYGARTLDEAEAKIVIIMEESEAAELHPAVLSRVSILHSALLKEPSRSLWELARENRPYTCTLS